MPRKGENIYKRRDVRWEGRYMKPKTAAGTISYGYCYGKSYKEVKETLALKRRFGQSNRLYQQKHLHFLNIAPNGYISEKARWMNRHTSNIYQYSKNISFPVLGE